ncbi:MAG: iron uptake transporter permease EfeU [Actinomycetota bacterium]
MSSAFLLMLREGLEAALIVAIVLGYLKRLGRERDFGTVWLGTAAAVVVSLIAGAVVFGVVGELEGTAEEVTEGIIAFTAAGVLTWMIFWMGRQARAIKGTLQAKVDAAVQTGSATALAGIAFVAVVREGLESALFMLSTTVGSESSGEQFVGGLIGIAIAAGAGYLVYRGSRHVNLRVFFRVTGVLIIVFAAGLLAKGIHEFQEVGFIATASEHVWNLTSVALLNPDVSQTGEFLKGIFGWSPDPSIEMVVAYFTFLIPVATAFIRGTRFVPRIATVRPAVPAEASAGQRVA